MAKTPLRKGLQRPTSVCTTSGRLLVLRPPRAHAIRLLLQVEVVAVEGFWFVQFARKGTSYRSPKGCYHHRLGWLHPFTKGASYGTTTGCYHSLRGWLHPGEAWDKRPCRESQVPTGGGPGERVPLGHSSGCPPLNGSSCLHCQRARRQGAQGQAFRLRFPQFVRSAFSAARRVCYRLANRRFHFPQDLDRHTIPIATATPRATLRGSPE